jgi:hypothetical protein
MLNHFARSQQPEGALVQTRSKSIGRPTQVLRIFAALAFYPTVAIEIEARIL